MLLHTLRVETPSTRAIRAGTRLAISVAMTTRRTRFAESSSLISDEVPTRSDELTHVTRLELARVLQALDMTKDTSTQPTVKDDVFAEDTLELYIDYDPTM